MPQITFPDGSVRRYDGAVHGAMIAENIGKRLLHDAVAVRVNGELYDLTREIDDDASIEIVTRESEDGLELLRHDAAHVLAQAVKELWPDTQITIGPAIENGFYYDFARDEPFSEDELATIEARMRTIVDRDETIVREVWDRDQAVRLFHDMGERYKAEIIAEIPDREAITLYRQGAFIDLCRGPHLPSTGKLGKAFKLTHVSGAYWRGDSNNAMLQRVYGTAWANDKQLRQYLRMLEEAERRDHRRLGRIMNLFHFQEQAPGAVFWHPAGWTLFQNLIAFMRDMQNAAGYREINTPELVDRSLWEASGHWDSFGDNMYTTNDRRRPALRDQANELSRPRSGLQAGYHQLPRAAAAPRRVRQMPPLRAVGGSARHDASQGIHAGRRARVLHHRTN